LREGSQKLPFKGWIHLRKKYNSIVIARPARRMKFKMCPTSKNLNRRNRTSVKEIITPLLVDARRSEKEKRRVRKTRTKNKGITPKLKGSMK
jgi:hypothetical protein